jgi:hypothetical protein
LTAVDSHQYNKVDNVTNELCPRRTLKPPKIHKTTRAINDQKHKSLMKTTVNQKNIAISQKTGLQVLGARINPN